MNRYSSKIILFKITFYEALRSIFVLTIISQQFCLQGTRSRIFLTYFLRILALRLLLFFPLNVSGENHP